MIVVLLNIYIVDPGAVHLAQVHSVQHVLEDLAAHRPAAAQHRTVHPDGMGRAAGPGGGGAQFGADRALGRGRSHRGAGYGQHGAQVRRRPVPHRSHHLSGDRSRGSRRSSGWQRAAPVANNANCRRAAPAVSIEVEQRQSEVDQLQGAARRRQVESRQDHGAGAGRRLRDQPRACARARASPRSRR